MTATGRTRNRSLDFHYVATEALHSFEAVMSQWLPGGKREGREWVVRNPTRVDNRLGSFSINMQHGKWKDFSTGDSGHDLVALVGYLEKIGNGEACRKLADFLRINPERPGNDAPASSSRERPSRDAAADYMPTLPVPPEALSQKPLDHPKLGRPDHIWRYLDASGELLFEIWRFDNVGRRGKVFSQLSYGLLAGKTGWHWKGVPAPRPLYAHDQLAARPTDLVVIVEGEKAADAAASLFPDAVITTWPGGAQAIGEVDFSPLRGRDVIYWPDNDKPGRDSVPKLRTRLAVISVSLFEVIDLTAFQRYTPSGDTLADGGQWPDKADAADAIAQGWQATHIEQLRSRGELLAAPSTSKASTAPAGGTTAPRYIVNDAGIHFCDPESGHTRRICARLDVVAHARDEVGRCWSLLTRFRDRDGNQQEWVIPLALFGGDTAADVIRGLLDRGLEIDSSRDAKRKLLEYLQGVNTPERVVLVKKIGWYDDAAFLLPDRTIGTPAEPLHYYADTPNLCRLRQSGALEQWRDQVAALCIKNPLLAFAVSAAFAAPLLDVLGIESTGFHYVGDSSLGKSTLLKVAASVCGEPSAYLRNWRATDNALEAMASAYSGLVLILDEIGQCDPRIVGETIYMLGNGEGKSRANDRGGARDTQHSWRLVFLSSGEKSLEQHMGEANKRPQAGMELRFLAIPACLHASEEDRKQFGIYNELHRHLSGAALSDYLLRECGKYHGTALIAFLEKLCEPGVRAKVAALLLRDRQDFIARNLEKTPSGQVKRAADKFALVGTAGELATRWGITGWPRGEAMQAADRCFQAWLAQRGGEGNLEEQKILDQIRHHFEIFGESRYTRWESEGARTDEHAPRTMERYGFRRTEEKRDPLKGDTSENFFYVFPEAFRRDVCKGLDYKRAARLLSTLGALRSEKDRFTGKARLPGSGTAPVACYIVRYAGLCVDDETPIDNGETQ